MFVWVSANVQHIGKHDVSTDEAEYIVRHAQMPWPEETGDAKLRVWGQTADGRYLQVVYFLPADEQTMKKKATKSLMKMNAAELAEATKEFDQPSPSGRFKVLSAESRMRWEKAKRPPGRPRKAANEKALRVLITMERDTLIRLDAHAARRGVSRSQLIADMTKRLKAG